MSNPNFLIISALLLSSGSIQAAQCQVDGIWYDYSNPKCSTRYKPILPTTNTKQNKSITKPSIKINRLYQFTKGIHRIVITTNKKQWIKCALYDKQNNPLTATKSLITPPVDEVQILTRGIDNSVHSAKCFQ